MWRKKIEREFEDIEERKCREWGWDDSEGREYVKEGREEREENRS